MVSFQGLRDSGASLCLIFQARPRLREVHWQAGDRPVPEPEVSTSGESALWVDPAEIPAGTDVAKLGLVEVACGGFGEDTRISTGVPVARDGAGGRAWIMLS